MSGDGAVEPHRSARRVAALGPQPLEGRRAHVAQLGVERGEGGLGGVVVGDRGEAARIVGERGRTAAPSTGLVSGRVVEQLVGASSSARRNGVTNETLAMPPAARRGRRRAGGGR